MSPPARARPVADGSLLVEYPGVSDEEANRAAVLLADALDRERLPGLLDAIPGARSLFCAFSPELLDYAGLERHIVNTPPGSGAPPGRRVHRIGVLYGGESGPDLGSLAARAGVPAGELARRHAAAVYRVAFLGFAPGFAYLTGVPAGLDPPRRATPRPRVPGGSLAIAGGFTGIYPNDGPGGWNLVGLAAARLFDPGAISPALFSPGDEVRFEALTPERFASSRASVPAATPLASPTGEPVFRAVSAGLATAVCGSPVHGRGTFGVPPGGAMDLTALESGNSVLGNAAGLAALEVTLAGPLLEALADCVVALAGAACDASLDGRKLSGGEPVRVRNGSRLVLGPVLEGVRAYLCVAGGLEGPASPGAPVRIRPGDTVFAPAPAGDLLSAPARSDGSPVVAARLAGVGRATAEKPAAEPVVRIVLGPQEDRFAEEGVAALLGSPYRVSSSSDRRGVRLEGPRVLHSGSTDIPPEGTALGAIQVPADGQPIVLGPDRPVTGGYAKVGTVIRADFPLIAQARPGSVLRFRAVSLREALEASRMSRP